MNETEYEPYGIEWKKEMNKFSKLQLIEMLKKEFINKRDEQKRFVQLHTDAVCKGANDEGTILTHEDIDLIKSHANEIYINKFVS